jgi:hypothetical protein
MTKLKKEESSRRKTSGKDLGVGRNTYFCQPKQEWMILDFNKIVLPNRAFINIKARDRYPYSHSLVIP